MAPRPIHVDLQIGGQFSLIWSAARGMGPLANHCSVHLHTNDVSQSGSGV